MKKAYKLFLHQKQSYQTKPVKNETLRIRNREYKKTSCERKLSWVKEINNSFSKSRFLLANRTVVLHKVTCKHFISWRTPLSCIERSRKISVRCFKLVLTLFSFHRWMKSVTIFYSKINNPDPKDFLHIPAGSDKQDCDAWSRLELTF